MNTGTRLDHYTLFAISFIAAVWFFVAYPSQDPRSTAKVTITKSEVQQKSTKILSQLGFSAANFRLYEVKFIENERLLDSLQHQLGRQQANKLLRDGDQSNLKPFAWQVEFTPKIAFAGQKQQDHVGPKNDEDVLRLILDENGRFIELTNEGEFEPQQKVQRSALRSVFRLPDETLQSEPLSSLSDSLLSRMLYFDMQRPHGDYDDYQREAEQKVRADFDQGIPYRHSVNDARALADYYLSKTSWTTAELKTDTVFVKRINTINAADIRYISSSKGTLGQTMQLDVVVAPTGALLQMNAQYNPSDESSSGPPYFAWDIIHTILILCAVLAALIIFFFRMRSRVIDSQSALIGAVIMGMAVTAYVFLQQLIEIHLFSGNVEFNDVMVMFLGMAVSGAISSIGFFILFSISDSLTRQHWPEKLSSYDYLRQGMVFNKPIGVTLLRSVGLAFVLAGAWTAILYIFPEGYMKFSSVFLKGKTAWQPLPLLLVNVSMSFGVVFSIFMITGSISYGRNGNRWVTGLVTIVATGIILPIFTDFGPPFYNIGIGLLLGIILTIIYLRWDLLTVLLSFFLFLGLKSTVSGWIISDSPDLYIFIIYMAIFITLAAIGFVGVYKGKEARLLPNYVPPYVEELAQEHRIKQELQIAREVQQSFLPSRTPVLAGLDVAAICQPAYETGGDYYDFIQLDDHRIALTIGDVSGKGIQAAFYMTLVKGMLHSLCHEIDSPAQLLCKANRLFYENASKGTFISLIYGIIDLQKNTFTFARAGHNPIVHVRTSSGQVEELKPNGLGLGLTKEKVFDNKIEEIELSVSEDDLFLLYTDGIVEALNQAHQFYGSEKLIDLIQKQKQESASEIVAAISQGVTRFVGNAKQHDDMTLMAIRFGKRNEKV